MTTTGWQDWHATTMKAARAALSQSTGRIAEFLRVFIHASTSPSPGTFGEEFNVMKIRTAGNTTTDSGLYSNTRRFIDWRMIAFHRQELRGRVSA